MTLLARCSRLFTPVRVRKLERVWMPCFLHEFEVRSRKGTGTVTTLIDAWSGAFSIVEKSWDATTDPPREETFPPRLTESEAVAIAEKQLLNAVVLQRARGGTRPVVEGIIRTELLHRPYWVLYYERWRGRLDIKVLDAVNGAIAGARTKDGILRAFRETDGLERS